MTNEKHKKLGEKVTDLLALNLHYNEIAEEFTQFLSALSKQQRITPLQFIDNAILYYRTLNQDTKDQILDFLMVYRISLISHRRKGTSQQIREASQGKVKLDNASLNEIVLEQNRARGKTFEQMGMILVEYYLRTIEGYSGPVRMSADKTMFDSIDAQGKRSKRRFDLYLWDFNIGVEIKSGRIYYNANTRNQISKDKYLLLNRTIDDVWWFLFYGASKTVLNEMQKQNISYIDLGFNDFENGTGL